MSEIYDIETYEPRRGVGYLINRVKAEMLAVVDRELTADDQLGPLEVSSAQFVILATLSSGGQKSASDLCKGISYDAGAMTRMIDRLEDKGLLQRTRSPEDRRLVYLELTDAGKAAFPRMREISLRVLNRFLRGFSKAEARQLEAYLLRMLENAPSGA
ncbi:MAG TPA: MarR family transcriptional regulator [Steroidobacteraceae bacterium]|nr:MarR family transcriptional regulator [Steroidobacteraceae bacterium]